MNIEFVARHVDLEDSLRALVEERLAKAVGFLREPVDVRVAFESGAGGKHLFAVELHVAHAGGALHARAEGPEVREATLEVLGSIDSQARKARKKAVDKHRRASRDATAQRQWPVEVLERESLRSGQPPRVIKSSRIAIEPMTIDEAAQRLEVSQHEFVVFVDSDRERVSVLYKRRDDDYGLIAPEF